MAVYKRKRHAFVISVLEGRVIERQRFAELRFSQPWSKGHKLLIIFYCIE